VKAKKSRGTLLPRWALGDARHEAAHAVVAVRLGLPLAYTSIEIGDDHRRPWQPSGVRSAGYTSLAEGTAQAWVDALPAPTARAAIEAFAAQCAAGIVADMDMGLPQGHVSHRDDTQEVVQCAFWLRLGESGAQPAVRTFVAAAVRRAVDVLAQDDGTAWWHVTVALAKATKLTGAEVRALVQ
jgi:hypothetical protein